VPPAVLTRHQLTLNGHRTTYRIAGDGPALLLLHGVTTSSQTWEGVAASLSEHFTLIAPDLMGHGESAAPRGDYSLGAHASSARDLLTALGHQRATVVGHSLGGGIAMQFAYQFPERCERLVLVSSGGLGREVSWLLRMLSLPGSELVLPIAVPAVVRDRGNAVSTWIRDRGIHSGRIAEMWRAYASLAEPENRQAFVRTLRAVVDPGKAETTRTWQIEAATPLSPAKPGGIEVWIVAQPAPAALDAAPWQTSHQAAAATSPSPRFAR